LNAVWHRVSRALAAAIVIATPLAAGCRAQAPVSAVEVAPIEATTPAPNWDDGIPGVLSRLELRSDQRVAIRTVLSDLQKRAGDAMRQRRAFESAIVAAARGCSANDSRLHIEADRFVEAAQAARPAVLDAINMLHQILDARQRDLLVTRLLAGQESIGGDGDDQPIRGLATIAEALDLSFAQKLALVKGAAGLDIGKVLTNGLKKKIIDAAHAFREPRFDIREHAIVEVPLVALYTGFMLDLAQIVLPVLEPEQCRVAADLLQQRYE
jgi:hypothetical protein